MFLCIPLRLGTFIVASLSAIVCLIFAFHDNSHIVRLFAGGYCKTTQDISVICSVTGVVFGVAGALGAWYNKTSFIKAYNWWQLARIVAWVFTYVYDFPLLITCDSWVNSIDKMTADHGWNVIMYQLAMDAECDYEKNAFMTWSILALMVFMYITYCTSRYLELMQAMPRHLLRAPKDLASGAFHAYSLGERSFLNGTVGKSGEEVPDDADMGPSMGPPMGMGGPMPMGSMGPMGPMVPGMGPPMMGPMGPGMGPPMMGPPMGPPMGTMGSPMRPPYGSMA